MSNMTPEDDALLEAARGASLPTADDQARVKRKLLAQIAVGVGVGTSAISTTSGAGAGLSTAGATVGSGAVVALVAKVVVGVALVGGAVGAGIVGLRGSSGQAKRAEAPAAVTPNVVADPRAAATSSPAPDDTGVTSIVAAPPLAAPPVATALQIAPQPSAPAPRVALRMPERSAQERGPAASFEQSTAPPASAQRDEAAALPVERALPMASTAMASAQAESPPPVPTGPATVSEEADLLRRADAARKSGDAPGALALLDEHRARFPSGMLVPEREAERVIVLCALGRLDDARGAASVFLRTWPRSPLAGRVRASCGGR
jgi:hypothetical protein